jgi:drug/metabolite transporter (DMT)-like permease
MRMAACRRIGSSRWFIPAFTIFLGVVLGGAQWKGGDPQTGISSLVLFAAIAAVFVFGGRSETIRALRGDGRDERWARIDLTATAASGFVVITAIIGACAWEWAHGRDGSPFTLLGAIAGVAYVAALAVLRARS